MIKSYWMSMGCYICCWAFFQFHMEYRNKNGRLGSCPIRSLREQGLWAARMGQAGWRIEVTRL